MSWCDCLTCQSSMAYMALASAGQTITDTYSGDYRAIDRKPLKPDKMDMGGSEEKICIRSGGWGVGCVMAGVGQ